MLFNDYQLIMFIKTTKDVFQNNSEELQEPKPGTHICCAEPLKNREKRYRYFDNRHENFAAYVFSFVFIKEL